MAIQKQSCDGCVSRRDFLTLTGSAVVGVALVGCATTAVYHLPLVQGKAVVVLQKYPELAVVGGMVQLRVDGFADPLILVRQDEKTYLALSAVCTHLRCFVRPSKQFLLCPCHGSTFDLQGNAVRGPAEKPLQRYGVTVVDGVAEIDLG